MTLIGYKKRLAAEATLHYKLADLIGISAGRLVSKEIKMPSIYTAYSGLLEPERPQQQDWQIMKARMMQYATAHNAKYGGKDNG